MSINKHEGIKGFSKFSLKLNVSSYIQTFFALACLAAAAHGAVVRPAYGAPAAYAQPDYSEPAVYSYTYAVADDYSGSNFQQDESRDGYSTKGSYSVALPDGRVQTVTYVVDGYNGYVADVTYSGEARYPDTYKTAPVYSRPVYKPAPAYHA